MIDARALRTRWIVLGGVVWAAAVAFGVRAAWLYEATPGAPAASAPTDWPGDVGFAPRPGRGTIVMLAHPQCPCTRASIAELAALMSEVSSVADAYVLFLKPSDEPDGWERSDTWVAASRIAGVEVIADVDGRTGERFGATVSGHTVVYDASGRRVFAGGITAARGRAGENDGERGIAAALLGGDGLSETPTYGCELGSSSAHASSQGKGETR